MKVNIREYAPGQLAKLHQAFIGAFSDYQVGFQPTASQFDHRINSKLNIAPHLSALAWDDDVVVGFVLHTLNTYQGKSTAYNGGTGVLPGYRKCGIGASVYEFLLPRIAAVGAQRVLLEVIDDNRAAGKLYESLGFRFTRVLKCFRHPASIEADRAVHVVQASGWKEQYLQHFSFFPSFMDSPEQIQHNLPHEVVLEAYLHNELAGHLVFQPSLGRISQLAVHPSRRKQGVGLSLLAHCQRISKIKRLTLMNIPEDQHETIEALQSLGFKNELNQFELELIL